MKKRLCVVTSSRSDFGLLLPFLLEIKKSNLVELKLVVTGTHLSPFHGQTINEIYTSGLEIERTVEIQLAGDTDISVSKTFGLGVLSFSDVFPSIKPDFLLVIGDRSEILAATIAAFIQKIPVIHLSGGEKTIGSLDDSVRHCITKLSHYHFVATDEYRDRVIQLGENPKNIFNVGELGLGDISGQPILSNQEVYEAVGISVDRSCVLVSVHPETTKSSVNFDLEVDELFAALSRRSHINIIFTKSNADSGGNAINVKIDQFVKSHHHRAVVHTSLGRKMYLEVAKRVGAVVGNSSSGLIEIPSLGVPTVNLGDRQLGRCMAPSVLSSSFKKSGETIDIALSEEFQKTAKFATNPYFKEEGLRVAVDVIENLHVGGTPKEFYDLNFLGQRN